MSKSIMIIDDSPSVRQVVSITLRASGYEVIESSDGKDALSKLIGQKVHMMICDVNMPNMDGIEFVKAVKKIAAYKFTPIVMLTEAGEEAKQQGREAGVKAWMVKPFQPTQLIKAVEKFAAQ